jgi:peroxiredoxin
MTGRIRIFALAAALIAVFSTAVLANTATEAKAKDELEQLMIELQRSRSKMSVERLIEKADTDLKAFIEKYPGTAASGSAMVTLGQIYSQIGRSADARELINKYISSDLPKDPSQEGMAWMSLANVALEEDEFDEAEKALTKAVAIRGLDPKMKASAQDMLSRLGTLKKLKIGSPAIDFSTKDIEGREISPSDYKGKVVLLDFWATWCAPCRAEMPHVKEVYAEYNSKGFDIIGISMDNNREQLDSYLQEQDMKWRQIYDGKGWKAEIGQLYAVSTIPATFLLDKQGRIRYKNLRGDELEKAVEKLLGE